MTVDDVDVRLRKRLVSLADAATREPSVPVGAVRPDRERRRSALSTGATLAAIVIVLGAAIGLRLAGQHDASNASGSPPAPVGTVPVQQVAPSPSVASSPLPSGGISRAIAITVAQEHIGLMTFVSAEAGRFVDLNDDRSIGPGIGIEPDQLVWAVRFQGDFTICNPLGVCYSPRPGTGTVFLDYFTGAFLLSEGNSPNP